MPDFFESERAAPRVIRLAASRGRIKIALEARSLGCDLLLALYGGRAHIGAIAFAHPVEAGGALGRARHREAELAGEIAAWLARKLDAGVALAAGIHYDNISASEIRDAIDLSWELAKKLAELWPTGALAMLSVDEIKSFEDYIKSGRFEAEFMLAPEKKRYEMLELLEEVMNAADLADEAATRIIFRRASQSAGESAKTQ